MSWRQRLAELVCAGGTLAACGDPIPCGNANPDPCICDRMPASTQQCVAEKQCKQAGGYWEFFGTPIVDAGSGLYGYCVPLDAGTPHD